MAGNLEVTDLPVIPAVENGDMYIAKNNLDYRVRTAEPGGIATLDGSGKVPSTQLPTNVYLPLTAGVTAPLTGSLYIGAPLWNTIIFQNTAGDVNEKRGGLQLRGDTGSFALFMTQDGEAGAIQWTWNFDRATGSFESPGNGFFRGTAIRVGATAGVGSSQLNSGDGVSPGYVSFYDEGGTRRGYVGYEHTNRNVLSGDNGWTWVCTSTFAVSGSLELEASNAYHVKHTGFVYFPSESPHMAYYKKNSSNTTHYYWRRSDTGLVGGPNETTMMELRDNGNLWVYGTVTSSGVASAFQFSDRTSGRLWVMYGTGDAINFYNGAGTVATIDPAGNVTATNFWATSDRNKKDQITDKPARRELADKLRLVSFIWKVNGEKDQGLIAQEVQEIAPEYVMTDAEGFLAVDKIGLLLECVVDLATRVKELEDATSRQSSA